MGVHSVITVEGATTRTRSSEYVVGLFTLFPEIRSQQVTVTTVGTMGSGQLPDTYSVRLLTWTPLSRDPLGTETGIQSFSNTLGSLTRFPWKQ